MLPSGAVLLAAGAKLPLGRRGVRPPAPDNVPRWLADEIIIPIREQLLAGG